MIYKVKSRETNKIDELSSGIALSFLYNTLLGRLILKILTMKFITDLGYRVNTCGNAGSPKLIQNILNSLSNKEEYALLSNLLLCAMKKAEYSINNIGHFGLALDNYTHFTSPIRRFPDTTVHRLLRTYLYENDESKKTIEYFKDYLPMLADHASLKERDAIECEREVEDMKMAEYMEKHIGEEFEGMISTVTNFGMFVELDNLIEGLVPIKDMNDFFNYDEERMTLTGERSHVKYTIGERVVVKVVRASKEEKMIDFEVVRKL